MIEISINDETRQIAENTSISMLLHELKIVSPAVAVEVNQQIQPRSRFESVVLKSGDQLEIVTLVGGG